MSKIKSNKILRLWNEFWFQKEETQTLGVFRVALGILILLILIASFPNWLRFYGPSGLYPDFALRQLGNSYWLSLFSLNQTPYFTWVIFGTAVIATITFIFGFKTRISTIVLFLIYVSLMHQNQFLVNGHDQIIITLLFFAIFAPLGSSISLDKLIRRLKNLKNGKNPEKEKKPRWALRLMQLSIAFLYLFSAPAKWNDDFAWQNGMAIYYVSFSWFWFRFPGVNLLHNQVFSFLTTFGTLITELAFPYLVWFSKTRKYILVAIIVLHISLLFFMTFGIFFFNLAMLVSFILFIPSQTTQKFLDRVTFLKNLC